MYNPNISSGQSHTRHWVRSAKHMSFDQPKNMSVHHEAYLYWASFEHTVSFFDNSSSFSCRNAKDMNPWQLHSFADILIGEYMGQTTFLQENQTCIAWHCITLSEATATYATCMSYSVTPYMSQLFSYHSRVPYGKGLNRCILLVQTIIIENFALIST